MDPAMQEPGLLYVRPSGAEGISMIIIVTNIIIIVIFIIIIIKY